MNHAHTGRPLLVTRVDRDRGTVRAGQPDEKPVDGGLVIDLVSTRRADFGDDNRSRLDHQTVHRFEVALALENGAVLVEHQIHAVFQRQGFGQPVRALRDLVGLRRVKASGRKQKGGDE